MTGGRISVPPATVAERAAAGKAARAVAPRSSHAALELATGRDPIALLEAQAAARVPELVPIRYGRMLVSPLAFYRGSATVMAHDLAATPRAGLDVQLCGDAHLLNFGGFASPDRALVFDLNDFDETLPGPFEWDVKRLAASFEVAGRDRGFRAAQRRTLVTGVVRAYRLAVRAFAGMTNLQVWYARLDERGVGAELRNSADVRELERVTRRARRRDSARALSRLTHEVDGSRRIRSDPPLIVPVTELAAGNVAMHDLEATLHAMFVSYRRSLPRDRRVLLEEFSYTDLARKVVGVGSVGTRCWILLLLGRDERDPLVLQIKEAGPSVLEPMLGRSKLSNHGERVVEGQRLMQTATDIFLGWVHGDDVDGAPRDFYVRQLWDWKVAPRIDALASGQLALYGQACGWTLARAHARTGDRIALAAYLGKGDVFDRAVARFASSYADVTESDHGALAAAVADGRLQAMEGV